MYPADELTRLATYKVALRRDIALRRIVCARAAARVTEPIAWVDRALAFVRRLSPLTQFAAVAGGLLFKRLLPKKLKFVSTLFRWGPTVFAAVRGMSAAMADARAGRM